MGKDSGENLIELIEELKKIEITEEKVRQNAIYMSDADGNIIEY